MAWMFWHVVDSSTQVAVRSASWLAALEHHNHRGFEVFVADPARYPTEMSERNT